MARTSCGMSASAVATMISAAAPYWVTETPITAASGPATSAPAGIAITEPRASYDETLASRSGEIFLASATVHCTIMISIVIPRPNEATQTTGSGQSMASDSGEIAIAPPISTTNSIGRRGVNRSDTRPPTIRPTDSAAVMAPQAAGPPRCDLATTGPSTWNAPYQVIMMTPNWATIAHSQVCERNSDQPSRRYLSMPEWCARSTATAPIRSSGGMVPIMPIPHAASAQPGPNAATHTPATTAPPICPAFIAIRLSALACCSSSAETTLGSSACDAG